MAVDDAGVLADAGVVADAGSADAGSADAGHVDNPKAAACASTFGHALTNAFGRLDGTLLAVVAPTDTQCPLYNSDHVVVQIAMGGAVYRVVVNVLSDGRNGTDTRVRTQDLHHALVGDPFAEGWHAGAMLDYPTSLDAHSTQGFQPEDTPTLVAHILDRLTLGAKISAYATSSGGTRADSAHLVHRNTGHPSQDGALVVDPDGADPTYILFHFDGDVF